MASRQIFDVLWHDFIDEWIFLVNVKGTAVGLPRDHVGKLLVGRGEHLVQLLREIDDDPFLVDRLLGYKWIVEVIAIAVVDVRDFLGALELVASATLALASRRRRLILQNELFVRGDGCALLGGATHGFWRPVNAFS